MQSVGIPRSMASQGSPRRAAESLEIAMCVRGVGVKRVRGAKGVVAARADHLCIQPLLEGGRHCPDGPRPRGRRCTRRAVSSTVPKLQKEKVFAGLSILSLKREIGARNQRGRSDRSAVGGVVSPTRCIWRCKTGVMSSPPSEKGNSKNLNVNRSRESPFRTRPHLRTRGTSPTQALPAPGLSGRTENLGIAFPPPRRHVIYITTKLGEVVATPIRGVLSMSPLL